MIFRIARMSGQASTSVALPPAQAVWRAKTTLCLVLGLLASLAGCGQKGPLTLPAAAPSASAPAAR